jgi:uncharacterized protein (DUF2252 family)
MKLDKTNTELKKAFDKLGIKAYFMKNRVRINWPHHGVQTHTYREAYRLMKAMGGNGKSVRPWAKRLKAETKSIVRTTIRNQLNKDPEDVHCSRKEASDPWRYS